MVNIATQLTGNDDDNNCIKKINKKLYTVLWQYIIIIHMIHLMLYNKQTNK